MLQSAEDDQMCHELVRLHTFFCWKSSPLQPSACLLARVGFYFDKQRNQSVCYKCKMVSINWEFGDDPSIKHRLSSPRCTVVLGTADDNVPLASPDEILQHHRPDPETRFVTESIIVVEDPMLRSIDKEPLLNVLANALQRAKLHGLFLDVQAVSMDRKNPNFDALRREALRLNTFYDWPRTAHVRPQDLARSGFIYFGEADRVQCVFCRNFLRNWDPEDRPESEHKKHHPDCPFVRGIDVGNIPLDFNQSTTGLSGALGQLSLRELGSHDTPQRIPVSPPAPVTRPARDLPQHPEYADESERIRSYTRNTVPAGQDILVLARAGYFHVGLNDSVKCFFCDGGLKNWKPVDDPWVEHAKWFPRCSYLRSQRDDNFIRGVQERNQPSQLLRQNLPHNSVGLPFPADNQQPAEAGQFAIEAREVKARMDSPIVQAVLDMGYSRDLVKQVIQTRLIGMGDDFRNAESLVDAIIQIEEQQALGIEPAIFEPIPPAVDPLQHPIILPLPAVAPPPAATPTTAIVPPTSVAPPTTVPPPTVIRQPPKTSVTSAPGKKKNRRKHRPRANPRGSAALVECPPTREDEPVDMEVSAAQQQSDPEQEEEMAVEGAEPGAEAAALIGEEQEAASLMEENRQLKEAKTCKVCMDEEVNTVFLPCGHLVCCNNCAPSLRTCPICRALIRGTVRIFLS